MYGMKLLCGVLILIFFQMGRTQVTGNVIVEKDSATIQKLEEKFDRFIPEMQVRQEAQSQQITTLTHLLDLVMKSNTRSCNSEVPFYPSVPPHVYPSVPSYGYPSVPSYGYPSVPTYGYPSVPPHVYPSVPTHVNPYFPYPKYSEQQYLSPTNCLKAQTSSVYTVPFNNERFPVYCDAHTQDGGWMVILRRQNGSINFYRDWNDYKHGFGNLEGEFFMGLEKLHGITSSILHELLIVMEDFEGEKRYAKYATFAIGSEDQSYALNVLGKYSGDAGDSLSGHAGQKFTTKDRDNDEHEKNCANMWEAAWWYKSCFHSNLMGKYLKGEYPKDSKLRGINWESFRGFYYSLKFVEMMIRPVKTTVTIAN